MPERLLDTSVVIDCLRGTSEAHRALNEARHAGTVWIHAVVEAEVIAGALDRRDLRGAQRFFRSFSSVAPSESDHRRSLVLFARHALPDGVEWHDCLIAASALRLGLVVVTRNHRHFRVFKGLRVDVPY